MKRQGDRFKPVPGAAPGIDSDPGTDLKSVPGAAPGLDSDPGTDLKSVPGVAPGMDSGQGTDLKSVPGNELDTPGLYAEHGNQNNNFQSCP